MPILKFNKKGEIVEDSGENGVRDAERVQDDNLLKLSINEEENVLRDRLANEVVSLIRKKDTIENRRKLLVFFSSILGAIQKLQCDQNKLRKKINHIKNLRQTMLHREAYTAEEYYGPEYSGVAGNPLRADGGFGAVDYPQIESVNSAFGEGMGFSVVPFAGVYELTPAEYMKLSDWRNYYASKREVYDSYMQKFWPNEFNATKASGRRYYLYPSGTIWSTMFIPDFMPASTDTLLTMSKKYNNPFKPAMPWVWEGIASMSPTDRTNWINANIFKKVDVAYGKDYRPFGITSTAERAKLFNPPDLGGPSDFWALQAIARYGTTAQQRMQLPTINSSYNEIYNLYYKAFRVGFNKAKKEWDAYLAQKAEQEKLAAATKSIEEHEKAIAQARAEITQQLQNQESISEKLVWLEKTFAQKLLQVEDDILEKMRMRDELAKKLNTLSSQEESIVRQQLAREGNWDAKEAELAKLHQENVDKWTAEQAMKIERQKEIDALANNQLNVVGEKINEADSNIVLSFEMLNVLDKKLSEQEARQMAVEKAKAQQAAADEAAAKEKQVSMALYKKRMSHPLIDLVKSQPKTMLSKSGVAISSDLLKTIASTTSSPQAKALAKAQSIFNIFKNVY